MSAPARKKKQTAADPTTWVDARTLIPSPENEQLYRERSVQDEDYRRFVDSVREHGVQAPLLVSLDNYIISGHQRQRAAIATGQFRVPIRRLNVRRSDYGEDDYHSDAWLALLREHNTGREKTFDELTREKLIDINPEDAVVLMVVDKMKRLETRVPTIMASAKEMKRYGISEAKRGMADAIYQVLQDLVDYLPVSLRAIHYRLLVKEFFRNSKTRLPYRNDLKSYSDLSDVATRMRIAGHIPWEWITDETRPTIDWECWRKGADFVAKQTENFLRGYARDLLQSQAQHFEIVVEKLTVRNFVEPVASRYRMPVAILRGNSSIDARYQLVERFRASGKRYLFLLCLGDCDPDGDSIVDSTLRSLRDDFHLEGVEGTRVAMTHAQADALHLPRTLEAKESSSNRAKFLQAHGRSDCYELEAVAPDVLQGWLDESIRGVLDVEAFNHEVEQQEQDAAALLAKRQAVLEFMRR
jgi:hypothetical protein